MKYLRNLVSVLGMLALIALFLKLPETPHVFEFLGCKTCTAASPYLPLIGSGYFALLIAISLLFPAFPKPIVARGGLIWAVLLFLALTYLDYPSFCPLCIIGHLCNILIWAIWLFAPSKENAIQPSNLREKLCLALFAPISVVALFSCLNLTFMAYGFKMKSSVVATNLKAGDKAPTFPDLMLGHHNVDAMYTVVNFVTPNCPYCKEQLQVLKIIADELNSPAYRFINITPKLTEELTELLPKGEWIEDKGESIRELYKVSGFPTLFIVGPNGRILRVFSGVSEKLKTYILASLVKKD